MKILYGTTNNGKLQAMKKALQSFDIELISLRDIDSPLPSINENGETPLENAEIKARAYYEAFRMRSVWRDSRWIRCRLISRPGSITMIWK